MSEETGCTRRLLASSDDHKVVYCSCGSMHVHTVGMTLHMDAKRVEEFTTVLARAMVNFAVLQRQEESPKLRLVSGGGTSTPPETEQVGGSGSPPSETEHCV